MFSMVESRRQIVPQKSEAMFKRERLYVLGAAVMILIGLASALRLKYEQPDRSNRPHTTQPIVVDYSTTR